MGAIIFKSIWDLLSRKRQGLSTIVLTACAAFLLCLSYLTLSSTNEPFNRLFQRLHGAHVWISFPTGTPSSTALAAILHDPSTTEISSPMPAISSGILIKGSKQVLTVIGLPDSQPAIGQLLIVQGTYLNASVPMGVVIDQQFAAQDNLHIGDTLDLVTPTGPQAVSIVGLSIDVNHGPLGSATPRIYMLQSQVSPLFGNSPQQLTLIAVRITDPSAVQTYEAQLGPRLLATGTPFGFFTDWLAILNTYTQFFQLAMIFLLAFGLVALVTSGLVIINRITGLVLAQVRDIGILKASGFTPGQVVALYLCQYVTQGLIAIAIALVASFLLAPLMLAQAANALDTAPVSSFNPLIPLAIVLGIILVVALSAIFPALRAGRISSVSAINGTFQSVPRRLSWLSEIAAFLGIPVTWTLGVGQSFARPWRAWLTMLSFVTMICAFVFTISIFSTIDAYSTPAAQGIYSSVQVIPSLYGEGATKQLVTTQPGVSSYYTILRGSFPISHSSNNLSVQFLSGNTTPISTHLVQGRWYNAGAREVVMPLSTLATLKLHVGDSIELGNPLQMVVRIVGVYAAEYSEAPALADQAILPDPLLEGAQDQIIFAVTLAPQIDATTWMHQVITMSNGRVNVIVEDPNPPAQVEYLKTAMSLPLIILAIVDVFSVLSAMELTVLERYRDLGIFKALGMTPSEISNMIQTSAILYALIALIIGIPLGVWFTQWIFQVIANGLGYGAIQTSINWFVLLGIIPLLSIVLALAGGYWPGHHAASVRPAEILSAQ